jgi:arabinogalactan endo-1,4-beta-galactosidase
MGGLRDGSFESGNLVAYWQNLGVTRAASLVNGNAFSGSYSLLQSNSTPYQVQTYQLVTNLPNGHYKLAAMVENSGGKSACYIGTNDKLTALPVCSQWTNNIVRGICVTNGQCLVTVYSDDNIGGNWCRVDFARIKPNHPWK